MGADYSHLGLNKRMQGEDSLPAKRGDYTSALDFDSNFEGAGAGNILSGKITGAIIISDGTNDRVIIGKLD